jgi:hypothetical protein
MLNGLLSIQQLGVGQRFYMDKRFKSVCADIAESIGRQAAGIVPVQPKVATRWA